MVSRRRLILETLESRTVPSFLAPLSYSVEDAPLAVLAVDLNADGNLDLVTANSTGGSASVLLGTGDGLFRAPRHYPTGRGANSVAAADFDGDGVLDLVTANAAVNGVSILRGLGDGTFDAAVHYAVGNQPRSATVADFNNDGFVDLLVLLPSAGQASLLLNNGDGTLQAPQDIPVGTDARTVVTADFDGDGNTDLAVTKRNSQAAAILLGNGDGTFRVAPDVPTGRFPMAAVTADFNGDAIPDFAVSTIDGATVLFGNGDGTFQRFDAPFRNRWYPTAIAAGDFNADGILDLALGGADADIEGIHGGLSIQLGNGDGTFQDAVIEDDVLYATHLATGDFNQDGIVDLASASYLFVCEDKCDLISNNLVVLRGAGDGGWVPPRVLNGGQNPNAVASGDFNGDGLADLVTASFGGIGVLLGNGDGSFGQANFTRLTRTPFTVIVGDFNGDGLLDAATTFLGQGPTFDNGVVNILLGNGDGSFQPVRVIQPGTNVTQLAAGDFNSDGFLDLAVYNRTYTSLRAVLVTLLLGVGDGDFVVGKSYELPGGSGTLTVQDFNGDGAADVAASTSAFGSATLSGVFVLLGNGDGTLQEPVRYDVGTLVQSVTAGDFNGDGIPDLAAALAGVGSANGGVQVLLSVGDGTFLPGPFSEARRGFTGLVPADFNGDGVLDLAGINFNVNAVSILLGTGDGSFRESLPFHVRRAPRDIAVADFNGDGWADLAVASGGTYPDYGDGGINLLLNDGAWPEGNLPNPGGLGDDPFLRPKRKSVEWSFSTVPH